MSSSHILTPIGLVAPTRGNPPRVSAFSLAPTWFHGHLSVSIRFHAQVQRLNIVQLRTVLRRLHGSTNSSRSCVGHRLGPRLCTATTSARPTYLLMQCNTSEQSMSRLTCTLFEIVSRWVKHVFSMFHPAPSMQISSPKGSQQRSSLIFDPA